ncbi:MAG: hypothetical protein ACRD4Y_12490 [Candidatus Acidiferrales bacterium]
MFRIQAEYEQRSMRGDVPNQVRIFFPDRFIVKENFARVWTQTGEFLGKHDGLEEVETATQEMGEFPVRRTCSRGLSRVTAIAP